LIDSHDDAIADEVWEAYAWVLRHTGSVATLIERDQKLPPFRTLLHEVQAAQAMLELA
jgi:uncharacterized protein (UPF0276 family)